MGQGIGMRRIVPVLAVTAFLIGSGASDASARTLRGGYTSFPDYLDPQLSYTAEGWTAMYDTYIPLLTYRHAGGRAGSEVIPGLARSMPRITDGGRTYTLFLRHGLRYSDGQEVRASDFRFAIERMFRLRSGGSFFYSIIVGARRYERKRRGSIRGIATNNRTGRITIHLERPESYFPQLLALLFAAPMPANTPIRDQSAHPPPATGPYVITKSRPGLGWAYVRNPEWRRHNGKLMPRLPGGHVSRIKIVVMPDEMAQVNDIVRGKLDWMFDPPPISRYGEVQRRYGGTQFRVEPTISTYYFWMNVTRPPFNNLKVRQAVNYAVDARALQRIYGDQIAPTQQILPPDMPGYHRFELYPHDIAKAERLIAEASVTDRKVTVWTDNEVPNKEAGAYYAEVLKGLGFSVTLKVVSAESYFLMIGNPATRDLDTGWSSWFEDFPHPADFFEPLLSGLGIGNAEDTNFSLIDDPRLNETLARLREEPFGSRQKAEYAAVDRSYMEEAPIVPYGSRTLSTFVSKAVDLRRVIWNPTFEDDLTSFQFK